MFVTMRYLYCPLLRGDQSQVVSCRMSIFFKGASNFILYFKIRR